MQSQVIKKVKSKMSYLRVQIMERSCNLAEEEHHSNCDLVDCGEHEINEFGKCEKCGLNEDQIDDHNMQWWRIIDDVEGNDDLCVRYQDAITKMEEWLAQKGVRYTA